MIVTEEEAKTKRCQEGYAASPGASTDPNTSYTVIHEPVPSSAMHSVGISGMAAIAATARPVTAPIFCVGSACMAWRWLEPTTFTNKMREPNSHGYCGKAGRP